MESLLFTKDKGEGGQARGEMGGNNYTSGWGEGTVDIEEADCILDRTIR